MRAGLAPYWQVFHTGCRDSLERVDTTDMHNIEGSFCQRSQLDGALGGFSLKQRRARHSVIERGGMASSDSFTYDKVNGNAIFGVYHDQPTQAGRAAQHAIDGLVIDHEGAGIGHQQLVGGHARADHLVHRFLRGGGQIGDGDVKAIIDDSFAPGFVMPGLQGFGQRMPALLIGEVENAGGTAAGRGDGACLEVIAGNGCGKWKFHVGVHVDCAWENKALLSIDDHVTLRRCKRSWRADGRDMLVLNQNIAGIIIGGSNDMSIRDECSHIYPPLDLYDRIDVEIGIDHVG